MKHLVNKTGRKMLLLISLFLAGCINVNAQNTSYSANTIPIGGTTSAAFGFGVLSVNTGSSNTAIGFRSLNLNTSGANNTSAGSTALVSNTTGSFNSAFGSASLNANTTGSSNTGIGFASLISNISGNENVANGFHSLYFNSTGDGNTASGYSSLENNTSGNQNTATGNQTLLFNTTGSNNSATGFLSLTSNTTGNNNTALGSISLVNNTTGANNTALGRSALSWNTTGNNNTAIGDSAGYNNNGNKNVFIGNFAGYNEFTTSNKLYIANSLSNAILYGDFSTGQVLLGKPIPTGYVFKGTRTLNVLGGIITDSVRVAISSAWADYVFSENYKLMPLEELYRFIKTNKHLPNIPTAEEVEKNGIELGEMNAKLLGKIEELHLYILQQQKQMEKQNKLNGQTQKEMKEQMNKQAKSIDFLLKEVNELRLK